MKRITFMSVAFLFLVGFAAESSLACTCLTSLKPLKVQVRLAFVESTAIFSGKVISITPQSGPEVAVKFKVGKVWKGNLAEEVTITTPQNSAMCGYTFEVGKTYLVYATGTIDQLMTTNCSRTTFASNKRDVKYLNMLKRRRVKSTWSSPHVPL